MADGDLEARVDNVEAIVRRIVRSIADPDLSAEVDTLLAGEVEPVETDEEGLPTAPPPVEDPERSPEPA